MHPKNPNQSVTMVGGRNIGPTEPKKTRGRPPKPPDSEEPEQAASVPPTEPPAADPPADPPE